MEVRDGTPVVEVAQQFGYPDERLRRGADEIPRRIQVQEASSRLPSAARPAAGCPAADPEEPPTQVQDNASALARRTLGIIAMILFESLIFESSTA
jgi:hypothetical protein